MRVQITIAALGTRILAKTAKAAANGRYERFKTGNVFDSTAKKPEWLWQKWGIEKLK